MKSGIFIRAQLEETLKPLRRLEKQQRPVRGWIRAIRDSLGMNGRQFANRLGVSPSRVTRLERDEIFGSVTLKTMQSAAAALDCVFVYGIVPKDGLERIVRKQAQKVAKNRLERTAQTMSLEAQGLSEKETKKIIETMVTEIVHGSTKKLWDK